MRCFFCRTELEIKDRVGRGMTCPSCKNDVHVCMNCEFYDRSAYNECRESQAERVLNKEKANFCDYFVPLQFPSPCPKGAPSGVGEKGEGVNALPADLVADAKKKLEELFKK